MHDDEWKEHTALLKALEREARSRGKEPPDGFLEQVAKDPTQREDELRRFFDDKRPLALVAFDTPGIQHYVFKVRRPVDLFGGSRLVADFTDPAKEHRVSLYHRLVREKGPEDEGPTLPESAVIFAGGGGGLLLVAACEAEDVVKALGEILHEVTQQDLKSVAIHLAVWPTELSKAPAPVPNGLTKVLGPLDQPSRYAATFNALVAERNRKRSQAAPLREPIAGERCQACSDHEADKRRSYEDGSEEKLCQPCDVRWRHGRSSKTKEKQPRTFEHLVENLDNTDLAVIYADGANVGRAFQLVQSMTQHRALSRAVDAAMQNARQKALEASPWLQGKENKHRAQYPICGGDDLVLVLPAQAVVDVVPPLIHHFEEAFDPERFPDAPQELRDQLARFGLGVGIAVAAFHFPVQFLVDYAYELLKSAKTRIREGAQQNVRSAVDFLVLRSGTPLTTSIETLRRRHGHFPSENGHPGRLLTHLPLSADDFVQQVESARSLARHVPMAQLQKLRQEIRRSPALSLSLWRYQHARAKKGQGWDAWLQAQGGDLATINALLWQEVPPPAEDPPSDASPWLATGYLDTLELLDLLPPDTLGDTP